MSTLVRERFLREMTDEMLFSSGLGMRVGTEWKPCFRQEKTDKRREEFGTYVHPSQSILTDEAGTFKREEIKHGFSGSVVPLTYTLEYKVSHEFMADLRQREVAEDSFKMGEAFSRRRYKNACQILYRGFDTVTSINGRPLFDDTQTLAQTTDFTNDNLLTGPLTTDNFDQAINMLMTEYDENGDVLGGSLSKVRLIVPPFNARAALQIAGSTHEPENMNNAINIYSGEFGRWKIEVVILPLLHEAPLAYRKQQWYVQNPTQHDLYFWEREPVKNWHIPDQNSLCTLFQGYERSAFSVWGHRGMIGSKGIG